MVKLGLGFCLAIAVAVTWGTSSLSAGAAETYPPQDQAHAPSAATGIVLIDIGEVFRNSQKFLRDMQQMKLDFDQWQSDSLETQKRNQERVSEIAKVLDSLDRDSAQYQRLCDELTILVYGEPGHHSPTRKGWIRREAQIYSDNYQNILEAVREYAESRGIGLVLRHHREPIDRSEAVSVMGGVNRDTVFHNLPDITDEIIRRLNEQDAASQPRNAETAAPSHHP